MYNIKETISKNKTLSCCFSFQGPFIIVCAFVSTRYTHTENQLLCQLPTYTHTHTYTQRHGRTKFMYRCVCVCMHGSAAVIKINTNTMMLIIFSPHFLWWYLWTFYVHKNSIIHFHITQPPKISPQPIPIFFWIWYFTKQKLYTDRITKLCIPHTFSVLASNLCESSSFDYSHTINKKILGGFF